MPYEVGSIPLLVKLNSRLRIGRSFYKNTSRFVEGSCEKERSEGCRLAMRQAMHAPVLYVRKFFCDMTTCTRKIFVERLTPCIEPWASVTLHLFQIVQTLGLATCGRLDVRVADSQGQDLSCPLMKA